jgi:Tat protein secretion system quality control protein TatD with DNase activity
MELAARLERPVSIHTVQCFGPLFATISQIKKTQIKKGPNVLPPKMYFHAFGGKMGTIEQILALCGRQAGKVYFGFAPIINFRSPKTATVVRTVGIERLVLETDHEDAALVHTSMKLGIKCIASALGIPEQEVIERTTANAFDLYNLNCN